MINQTNGGVYGKPERSRDAERDNIEFRGTDRLTLVEAAFEFATIMDLVDY